MRSCFNLSPSTYALRPAFASRSRVFRAASAAACTAAAEFTPRVLARVSMKAASGSTSVREGGRARVYVYSFSSADESAADQIAGVSVCASERCVWRPCARAEKKMLP